ncbi:MAG: hypothetical protein IK101_01885 [Oscillospiraceae bacterium]|jgi:hypothetical protein|nr:hypothetical protein [Oscillospiraceae bacterium]
MNTYNDTFVEHIVRRKRGGAELLVKIGFVVLALILIALAFWFLGSFFPFFFAVILILLFFAFKYTVKEFEYSFINGDVDIDRIDGKRRRKNILSVNCREITSMAPCEKGTEVSGNFAQTFDYSEGKGCPGRWYFTVERADGTSMLVYFSPSERLLNAFKLYLGRRMDYVATQTEEE